MTESQRGPDASGAPEPERIFAEEAAQKRPGFFSEFWAFLKENKKWWLLPILLVLLLLGLLALFASSGAAPFIYTVF